MITSFPVFLVAVFVSSTTATLCCAERLCQHSRLVSTSACTVPDQVNMQPLCCHSVLTPGRCKVSHHIQRLKNLRYLGSLLRSQREWHQCARGPMPGGACSFDGALKTGIGRSFLVRQLAQPLCRECSSIVDSNRGASAFSRSGPLVHQLGAHGASCVLASRAPSARSPIRYHTTSDDIQVFIHTGPQPSSRVGDDGASFVPRGFDDNL